MRLEEGGRIAISIFEYNVEGQRQNRRGRKNREEKRRKKKESIEWKTIGEKNRIDGKILFVDHFFYVSLISVISIGILSSYCRRRQLSNRYGKERERQPLNGSDTGRESVKMIETQKGDYQECEFINLLNLMIDNDIKGY